MTRRRDPRVLVVEHEAALPARLDRGAGWSRPVLALDVCRPYAGDALPATWPAYDGLLVLGGAMGAYDDADGARG